MADAITGALRSTITKEAAVAIAQEQIITNAKIGSVEYLEQVGKHSEYRERPLPAYAISFQEPACTIYVAAETGTYQTIRHNQWRAFDFLWMLHTMDYEGRDNFGNIVLRAFPFSDCLQFVQVFYYSSFHPLHLTEKRKFNLQPHFNMKTNYIIASLLFLSLLISCNQKQETKTTQPVVEKKIVTAVVIPPQAESDTLKGSLKALATGKIGNTVVTINYCFKPNRWRQWCASWTVTTEI